MTESKHQMTRPRGTIKDKKKNLMETCEDQQKQSCPPAQPYLAAIKSASEKIQSGSYPVIPVWYWYRQLPVNVKCRVVYIYTKMRELNFMNPMQEVCSHLLPLQRVNPNRSCLQKCLQNHS